MEVQGQENIRGLKVRMLGECSLEYGGRPILREKNPGSKTFQLLQILLYAGPDGIRRERLIAWLFENGSTGDSYGNLRVTIHNLRKLLRESGLPKEPYICLEDGCCRFQSSFPVSVDALTFDCLIKKAGPASGRERMELLKQACRLYGGRFLPPLAGESWVDMAEACYQRQYNACLREVCNDLKERGEYRELLELCSRAASIYPYDEWQIWQMDCLTALGRGGEAMALYERTVRLYFEELKLQPSERMLTCFRQMEAKLRMDTEDLCDIQDRLREKEAATGAYFCSYPGFVDSYRMLVRILEPSGLPASLVVCALCDRRKRHNRDSRDSAELSEVLSEAIREALRPGDVYTRYSRSQFLLILVGIPGKDCAEIVGRIDAGFRRREKSRRIQVTYRIVPIIKPKLQLQAEGHQNGDAPGGGEFVT